MSARVMVVALALLGAACRPSEDTPRAPVSTAARAAGVSATLLTEAEVRDQDIEFYARRVERDPSGAIDLARLASLYLQRSRETGDPGDAVRAEQASRRSLHNRTARNDQGAEVLAASLLSQHRFTDALVVARALSDHNPEVPTLRAAVGEIEMELGNYDSARVIFKSLGADIRDLSVGPRLARWAEIEGKPEEAKRILKLSLGKALEDRALSHEQQAWFWLRLGDMELRSGQPDAAEAHYQNGLAARPGDYRVLAALAHLAAVRHQWNEAIRYGEDALASTLDPATLGTLSDSYAALGDTASSAEYARALDVAVMTQPGSYHRAWSLFLLDHGRHVATVTRKVREELRTRRDIYGYDLLAWALHAQGRDREAAGEMAKALSEGTADALLFYHAGMIERALGDTAAARAHLTRALALNPYFQTWGPDDARAALSAMSSADPTPVPALTGAEAQ